MIKKLCKLIICFVLGLSIVSLNFVQGIAQEMNEVPTIEEINTNNDQEFEDNSIAEDMVHAIENKEGEAEESPEILEQNFKTEKTEENKSPEFDVGHGVIVPSLDEGEGAFSICKSGIDAYGQIVWLSDAKFIAIPDNKDLETKEFSSLRDMHVVGLVLNEIYTIREIQAPENYKAHEDFRIRLTESYGKAELIDGDLGDLRFGENEGY